MTDARSPDWDELRRLAEAATPGPWVADATPTDGTYGSGTDTSSGFDTYAVYCERGEIMDAGNSDLAEVLEEYDETGRHAWDETARRNMEFVAAANPTTILALLDRAEKAEAEAKALREDGTAAECVALYLKYLAGLRERHPRRLREIAGRNLACWCRTDAPHCHADVLLEIANG